MYILIFLALTSIGHDARLLLLFLPGVFWICARMRHTRRRHAARWMARAAWQFARGDDLAAARSNARVLALDPDCAPAFVLRGMIHTQVLRFREAIEDFDHAIILRPNSAFAIYRRGLAKHCLGDLDGAIADYDRVMHLEPECADAAPSSRRCQPTTNKNGLTRPCSHHRPV